MRKGLSKAIVAAILLSCGVSAAFAQTTLPPVELHGYIQNRLYANPDDSARFSVYRLSLQASAKLADDRTAYAELYYQPWVTDAVSSANTTAEQSRWYLESAYMDTPFAKGKLRIGKGRLLTFGMVPTVANRKSTEYNILAETFTQDRVQGIQYTWKQNNVDGGLSLYTDNRLGVRRLGEIPGEDGQLRTVKHFADREDNANLSGRLAVAARYGWAGPCWKLHVSGAIGRLLQKDADKVAVAFSNPYNAAATTSDKSHTKYGIDAQWAKGTFVSSGEYYAGEDSFLTIKGYSLMVGYEPVNARRVYLRYSALSNNQSPTSQQESWGTQQLIGSVVQPIGKGVWAELEYVKNMESPKAGTAELDNDLFFLEIFTGF